MTLFRKCLSANRGSHRRILAALGLAALLLGGASSAWAVCVADANFQTKNVTLNLGTIVIRDDMPIGTELAMREVSIAITPTDGDREFIGHCVEPGALHGEVNGTLELHDKDKGIYKTNIEGIGIQLMRYIAGANKTVVYPHIETYGARTRLWFYQPTYFRVKLIKIGEITSGGKLDLSAFTTYYADGSPNKPFLTTRLAGEGVIETAACTLDPASKNVHVGLGSIPLSDFSHIGSVTRPQAFDINLNCVAKPYRQGVRIRFDATANASGAPGVIQLTKDVAQATGLGIRILKGDGNPITLNEFWDVGQVPSIGGPMPIPMQAQYYQTAEAVTPGTANGVATFTLDYK